MSRNRATKADLQAAGYYAWLEECHKLKEKKKAGIKLTKDEKSFMRTRPTTAQPYRPMGQATNTSSAKVQRSFSVDFGVDKEFKTGGNSFFCEVRNVPFTDEECLLFCSVEDCPFNGKGYFRTKGIKF